MYRRYIVVVESEAGPEILGPYTITKAREVCDSYSLEWRPVIYKLRRVYE